MKEVLKDIDIVVFDIMGVIISNSSLVRNGVYPFYKDRYSYDYVKDLYRKVRARSAGDNIFWEGLGVEDYESARREFLENQELEESLNKCLFFLEKNGIRKGILSNMPKEWGRYLVKKFKFKDSFDPIVLGGEIGMKKPNKEIYLEFERRSGVPLNKSLFIDDKLSNLESASRIGVKTIHFKRGENKNNKSAFQPDYEISNFAELF